MKSTVLSLLAIVAGMAMLSYASVPLYRLFCEATGFEGTPARATEGPGKVYDRTITIRYNTDTASDLPWKFLPPKRPDVVKVGEVRLTAFSAENRSDKPITGTATFNVTPDKAGQYFTKIQCFCFDQQTLNPHEKVSMPVTFFVDPAIMNDPNLDDVDTITLSYTFFKV